MAPVLLSYVVSDEAEAKRVLALLEGARYAVYVADADRSAVASTSVVVVIWSAEALASPYVYELAIIALKSRRLVQLVTNGLDASLLPAVFRIGTPIPITDSERIIEQVKSVFQTISEGGGMSLAAFVPDSGPRVTRAATAEPRELGPFKAVTAEPEEPAPPTRPAPATPPQIPPHLAKRALETEAGQLNHKIPTRMRVGATETVEARLGRAHQGIAVGIMGSGAITVEDVPIVQTMTVNLYGAPDAFKIVRQSRETQLVMGSLIWNSSFDDERFGRWLWQVTPKKSGTHELVVHVSADMSDSRGIATTEAYRDRIFVVKVGVNFGQASVKVLKWTAAGAVSGLAGAYSQEIWWPKVRALLMASGLLS